MPALSSRHAHLVFGVMQSGLTTGVATAVASFTTPDDFLRHWLGAWVAAWLLVLPVVVLAAPALRRLSEQLTGGR